MIIEGPIFALVTPFEKNGDDRDQKVFNTWTDFRRSIQTSEISVAKTGLYARIKGFPVHTRPPLLSESNQTVEMVVDKLRKDILPLFT